MKILGLSVDVKIRCEDTGGAYYVFHMTIPAGEGVPAHVHTLEDEVICILEGELEVTLGAQTSCAKTGDTLHFVRNLPHGFKNQTNTSCTAIVFVSPGDSFEQFFDDLTRLSKGPDTEMDKVLALAGKHGMTFL